MLLYVTRISINIEWSNNGAIIFIELDRMRPVVRLFM